MVWTPPLSFSISLSPATLTHFTIFCCGRHLPPFLSHSRFLSSATLPTLLSSVGSTASLCLSSATLTFTLQTHTLPPSLFLSRSLSLSLALSLALSLSLFLSLSLQPHSPILLSSVVDATSLPFSLTLAFSLQPHSPTLLSSVGSTASLCLSSATLTVTLLTRTLPPSLSISLSPANHDMSDWSLHFPYSSSLKHKVSSAHGPPLGYGPYLHPWLLATTILW